MSGPSASDPAARFPSPVSLLSLVTVTPDHHVPQAVARERARTIFGGRMPFFDQLQQVFDNAAIDTRHSCLPVEWFMGEADFGEKSRLYLENATSLARDGAAKALGAAGLQAEDIDAIVFVSSTGIATPSIEARVMNLMPFRRDVVRLPVFGLGCAGGVLGLSRAAQMARAMPGANILLIVVEFSSLAFRHDRLTKSNLVACALFGDGGAAAVLRAGEDSAVMIGAGGEHCWRDTLGVMGWDVDGGGLDVIFKQSIPEIVARDYPGALDAFLDGAGLARGDIDRPCCHPGGAKVVDALEDVLGYARGGLDAERKVLRENGNMSAPTVLFVLEELLKRGEGGALLLSSLGPGFTAAFQMVHVAPAGIEASRA